MTFMNTYSHTDKRYWICI